MIRRTKGTKRYAQQRERMFTDPLIREDELQQVKAARERLSRQGYEEDQKEHDEAVEKGNVRDDE